MILNLTQHQATPDQRAAGVIDLPEEQRATLGRLLTAETLPTRRDIDVVSSNIAALALMNGLGDDDGEDPVFLRAMIGGAPWLMAPLVKELADVGIEAIYAFSVRDSVEQTMPDGSVRKVNVFKHCGFV